MSALNCSRYQYRSFESTYLFKEKSGGEIFLKIFDLSQKCLFDRPFPAGQLSQEIRPLLIQGHFVQVLEKLVEKQILPQKYVSGALLSKPCEQVFDQIIEQFKPRVCVESKELEGFICPLTLEVFQEPVMDEHGHTFEKSAIETHLKTSKACPISRQPIGSLAPNLLVKQTIEERQKLDPIPSFSLFQKENPKLAKTNLQMAQTYVEEGEYKEALRFYAEAFRYTRNDEDYAALPSLFEKMGEYEKATLAYLQLAKYQFLAKKPQEAINTLETCQKGKSAFLQNNLILIELYFQIGQSKQALALAMQTAEAFSKKNPEQAIFLYKRILQDHPLEFSLHSSLAALVEDPQERGQILLKGALEAMQAENYLIAEKLIQAAEKESEDSFINSLVSLDFVQKHGGMASVKQKLLYLARVFEQKQLAGSAVSAYKMLFQLERNPEYCQKILNALQKPEKKFVWSLTLIALFIEKKEWAKAEELARQTLQKAESKQKVTLYEKLEEIYVHWHGHELQDLWPELGKVYRETQQFSLAEKTYRKALEKFSRFEEILALAEVLQESGKTQESVHTYYEAAAKALLEQNSEKLSLCTREIKRIDPQLQHLDLNQKMHLLTHESLLKLSSQNAKLLSQNKKLTDELSEVLEEMTTMQGKIVSLEQAAEPLTIIRLQGTDYLDELEYRHREDLNIKVEIGKWGLSKLPEFMKLFGSRVTQLENTWYATAEDVADIAAVLPGSGILYLNLSYSKIGDAGVREIAAVLPQTRITLLRLNSCKIGDAGAQALAAGLRGSQVNLLWLVNNEIEDAGTIALATALPDSRLTRIVLSCNKIGDDGAKALAEALPNSRLTELVLGRNPIKEAGDQALTSASQNSQVWIRRW